MRVIYGADGSASVKRGAEIYAGSNLTNKIYLSWVDGEEPISQMTSNIPLSKLVVYINITRYDGQESGWQLMVKSPSKLEYTYSLQMFDTMVDGPATAAFMWYNADSPEITYSCEECGFIVKKGKIVQPTNMNVDAINNLNMLVARLQTNAVARYNVDDIEIEDVTFAIDGIKEGNALFYNFEHIVKSFNWVKEEYDLLNKKGTLLVMTSKENLQDITNYTQYEFFFVDQNIFSRTLYITQSGTNEAPVVEIKETTDFYDMLDIDMAVYQKCLNYIYNRVPFIVADKIILPVENWENNQLTISDEEYTTLNKLTEEMMLNIVPDDSSAEEYYSCNVNFVHGDGNITFTCTTKPTSDLEVTFSNVILNANFQLYAKKQAFLDLKSELEEEVSSFIVSVNNVINTAKTVNVTTKTLSVSEGLVNIESNNRYVIDTTNISELILNNISTAGQDAKYYNLQIKAGENNVLLLFENFGNCIVTDGTNKTVNEYLITAGTTCEISLEYDSSSIPLAFVCAFDTPEN